MKNEYLVIENGTILTPEQTIEDSILLINEGKIIEFAEKNRVKLPSGVQRIDATGKFICPGLINIHLHGGGQHDTMEGSYEAIYSISKAHTKHGTTSIVPTIAGFSEEKRKEFFLTVNQIMKEKNFIVEILGVNWETPFINPKMAGAFDKSFIRESIEMPQELLTESLNTLKIVTLAPELPGAIEAIELFVKNGVKVSIGHTNATYNEALAGINAGATLGTHIFNASSGLHHREPGTVGALLLSEGVIVEVIADGYHLHPKIIELIFRIKGLSNIALITDSIEASATDLKEFTLNSGLHVSIKDGRTWGPEGQLIGSILTMDQAVKNFKKWLNLTWNQALIPATLVPANILGVEDRKGSIKCGKDADLIIVDKDFNVNLTIVRGQIVYSN